MKKRERSSGGCWLFTTEGETVILRAHFEAEGGFVADAMQTVHAGEAFEGVSFEELRQARSGRLIRKRGRWCIAAA